jgi:hypothetical protein
VATAPLSPSSTVVARGSEQRDSRGSNRQVGAPAWRASNNLLQAAAHDGQRKGQVMANWWQPERMAGTLADEWP